MGILSSNVTDDIPNYGRCEFVEAERLTGRQADSHSHDRQKNSGLGLLLCRPTEALEIDPKALFLGPKAENAELVERMLRDVFLDHAYWRRNFHPEDLPIIDPQLQDHASFKSFWAHFQRELQVLLGELKSDVPFFSPRYIGHMTSDNSLPAVIAYIATMLYDPNNVSWEAAPITTLLEIQVGRELAKMVGFGSTEQELNRTWGHITSGGTLANIESIWVAKAVKFLPIALRLAAEELGVDGLTCGQQGKLLQEMDAWELSNLSPREALDLKDEFIEEYGRSNPKMDPDVASRKAMRVLKSHEILSLGDHAFFSRLSKLGDLNTPIILVPETMHYSWVKGAGAIGVGSDQIVTVPVDRKFRMNTDALQDILDRALKEKRPIIEVVAVTATTEEGSVDPLHKIVDIRDQMSAKGLSFFLHSDAAYGGYLVSCFRTATGDFRSLDDMQREYDGWPSEEVYKSFQALKDVDSITIDPHKLGYVPYAAGAVVFCDGRSKELVAHEAAYALGGSEYEHSGQLNIGKYILEGSKPGAAAAAVFLSQRVIPLDERGYGKILGQTIRSARSFHHRLREFSEKMRFHVRIEPLVFPDTSIINYLINPNGNDRLDVMNRFSQDVYRRLSIDTRNPVQTLNFIVTHTELHHDNYNPTVVRSILSDRLGIDGDYFLSSEEVSRLQTQGAFGHDDKVVVFRATLMNPFILEKVVGSKDYIDLYFEKLADILLSSNHTY